MNRAQQPKPKRYEEHAYVLDYEVRAKSRTVKGKNGIIVTAIGEDWLSLLEMLGMEKSQFEAGERVYIGKTGRTKVESVLGKIEYSKISQFAQDELNSAVVSIVANNEARFVAFINNAQPLTPRTHTLELIPGIGKTYMKAMLDEIAIKKFESYQDLQDRVGFYEPIKHISERILIEIAGESRTNLFVRR